MIRLGELGKKTVIKKHHLRNNHMAKPGTVITFVPHKNGYKIKIVIWNNSKSIFFQ